MQDHLVYDHDVETHTLRLNLMNYPVPQTLEDVWKIIEEIKAFLEDHPTLRLFQIKGGNEAQIKRLFLQGQFLLQDFMQSLCHALKKLTALTHFYLDFSHDDINNPTIEILCQALSRLPRLQTVCMIVNIRNTALPYIVKMAASHLGLIDLKVKSPFISQEESGQLTTLAAEPNPFIRNQILHQYGMDGSLFTLTHLCIFKIHKDLSLKEHALGSLPGSVKELIMQKKL